ncbi:MAG: transcriptional regulator with PAS, ATPase and Fis domain [Cyclobacteriaceae bacterium]|jgi:transcriptional regulator with PAS, ATPase and Fis domain
MDYSQDPEVQPIKQRFGIIGNSPKLNYAIRVAMQVAPTDMSVLISGESGSGKESFSKIIHSLSSKKHGQFIAINCGAIPEGTIDSELFGHERGAFTGAHEGRKGYFEVTNGGTIFLDEIGEMPVNTQARLLRVLENGEFIKVGSSKVLKTEVRVIAATNVNLNDAIKKGKFREDLYYRLNTVPIYVPALRERDRDILLLFRKFASDFSETYRTKPINLNEEASEILIGYRFPGNIRQLKNLVEQMSVLEMDRKITADKLRKYLPGKMNALPALVSKNEKEDNFSERDILYKVLFDLKSDVSEMKQLVHQILRDDSSKSEILSEHERLFTDLDADSYESNDQEKKEASSLQPLRIAQGKPTEEDYEEIEDISHETEEDYSLSLEKKEKEMIIMALKKNKNKRKYAAQDLGISERTLYRKIKQYELESI